jgi:class 3 adenylate cyclase
MAELEISKLVDLANHLIAQKTGEQLNDVQKTILRQALVGQKLRDIQVAGYSGNTVQREIAPKLWKRLTEATGKKVSIKTVRLVLEELCEEQSATLSSCFFSTSEAELTTPKAATVGLTRSATSNSTGVRSASTAVTTGTMRSHSSRLREVPLSERDAAVTPRLELPGGQLDLASNFYVERPPIEDRAYEEIAKLGSLIRIKAPKQMGKTSLMARMLAQAEQQGCRSVVLNFELADSEVFSDLNQFLQWFCATVTDDLQLPIQLETRWSKFLGSKKNCTNYFEKYLLPEINVPLALGLDAVDRIFPHEQIADDFFGLLRAWHEKAKQSDIWKNFRLVILHGTEVYIPLSNDQSPFNVGLPIELWELNSAQVNDLARRHGLNFTPTQVEQLMAMVGGHPHLVRLALYKIARKDITLEKFLEDAPTEAGIYADRLRLHLWNLEQHPELAQALKQVVETDTPVQLKSALAFKLNSMGLVHLQGNQVTIRYNLYRQYFRERFQSEQQEKLELPASEREGEIAIGKNVLAAIVFTDVKDSTQKQHTNQKPTLAAIHRDLNLMTKLCQQFEGQVLKSVGDGLLMYFVSAVKAVRCAQEIQNALSTTAAGLPKEDVLEHRIGIHLAEVFFDGADVKGDGVNIASRLQSEAEPGEICISSMLFDAVKTHLQLQVTRTEHRKLKGIEEPMLLYQIAP